jgi:uncharacterized protein (DUF2147 family)
MTARGVALFFASCFLFPLSVLAAGPDAIVGVWSTEENESKIEIFKRGERYYGKIVALTEPVYPEDDKGGMAGKPKVDRKNPNPAFRNNPIIGLELMSGFKFAGGTLWEDGMIYDPESGKTYRCKVTLESPNTLKVRGFIGISLLGRTTVWTR